MDALIRAGGISLAYRRRPVLRSVSMDVGDGEVIALLGRSGSGKTTLLLVLAGLIRPDAGSVRGPATGAVYVPQAPSLVPELTAAQNVELAVRLRGADPAAAHQRAVRELDAVQVAEAADALPHQLSGGMAQRTALARALALDPVVLLADEPTGSLDRATGARVVELLLARAGAGRALVVATHDEEVAARLAARGRVLRIADGILQEAA
jgi:ABC-type nitrate/sulfonate/bicarbonate transport system ATPase subunit